MKSSLHIHTPYSALFYSFCFSLVYKKGVGAVLCPSWGSRPPHCPHHTG